MHTSTVLIVLIAAVMLAGCTPFGDGALRKTVADGDAPAAASVALAETEAKAPVPDRTTAAIIRMYGPTIRAHAERYGFDWRLILATMKQESRFSPTAESHQGAYGLMQLMPGTQEELARVLALDDMSHPHNNIRGGIYYMHQLYKLFEGAPEADRLKLTLAAYNAGIGRVYDAQEIAAYLREDPLTWEAIRDVLPLLSRRYETLHQSVWEGQKPRTGFFGNARETVRYVEGVMAHYDEYRLYLN